MTVLIVDDDPTIAQLIGQSLEREGFTIQVAHTLAEAIAAVPPFDCIVADVRLPNGDGRHLRDLYPGVPFLSMSGAHGEIPDLPKPFSMLQLRYAVRHATRGS